MDSRPKMDLYHLYNLSKMILSEDDKPIIHTHNYIEESRTEATCLSPSIVTYRCDGCGDGYNVLYFKKNQLLKSDEI